VTRPTLAQLLADIDKAVAILKAHGDSADLQYCCGYLEGFRELLIRGEAGELENTRPVATAAGTLRTLERFAERGRAAQGAVDALTDPSLKR